MWMNNRILIACLTAALAAGVARPAAAQGGASGRGSPPPKKSKVAIDTTKKTVTQAGVALDFQDQELRVVLDALAAAGDLNVSFVNIPATRVTVHMGRPVTRDGMIDVLKQVAESNGLKFTQTPTLIQVTGQAPETPATRNAALATQFQQAAQAQQMRLFTYRLRHASAVQLAPVLTNLFAGFSGNGAVRAANGTTIVPNGNGGISVFNAPPGNIAVPNGNNNGRGGFGRGNFGNNNNQANQATAIQSAITSAFAAANGALSSQAGDIRIIAEESTNSLLVRATESDWSLVQQIIQGIDLRPLQVLIEVTIAEVQRTHDYDLGVSGNVIVRNGHGLDSASAPTAASARDFILALTGGHGSVSYNVALAALQERGDVKVLSLPVIIAQNNRQASLNVGSSRPFVQVSQTVPLDPTSRVETIQYIDVGTVLTITPTINPDGYVNLQVTQTDNSASTEVQFDAPVINKREATTQIFIRDGQTTVIGGLADNTHSSDVSGIPYLSRIPVIGPLIFGRTTKSEATNELFLFLTPHIISSDEDIDRLRDAVKQGSELLKDVDVTPHINPMADTLKVNTVPRVRPDSTRPNPTRTDSLTTLRRRPPAASRDTTTRPPASETSDSTVTVPAPVRADSSGDPPAPSSPSPQPSAEPVTLPIPYLPPVGSIWR
jgi:type II secretory pathway component GspD/PulD (secretin)